MTKNDHLTGDPMRSAELSAQQSGVWQTTWQLTTTQLIQPVQIKFPPLRVLPIIFVPGIMGSNLCDLDGTPVWLLNGIRDRPLWLVTQWSRKSAGYRQAVLHPDRTKVFTRGSVPRHSTHGGLSAEDYLKRGWGEVSESSYHKFLLWLDEKLNRERDPLRWSDFSQTVIGTDTRTTESRSLPTGIVMQMRGLPERGELGSLVAQVRSEDLLRRAQFIFPVYAFGYNWLASNLYAARHLKARIEEIIAENNRGAMSCKQVILVTHSMGGLVARACSLLPDMTNKVLGVVHGVMPSSGAAVAYRRCKVGMYDEDKLAGMVIGSDGPKVTAVFAQAPGALQLLPSTEYGTNWLHVNDASGVQLCSLPKSDPYDEIYLVKDKWWGLIRQQWLSPVGGRRLPWERFVANVKAARDFHLRIAGHFHPNTYVIYGGGSEISSFSKIKWQLERGLRQPDRSSPSSVDVIGLNPHEIETDGSNKLLVESCVRVDTTTRGDAPVAIARDDAVWEIRCGGPDVPGDGTVPMSSGSQPFLRRREHIIQQFQLTDIQHESVYRDSSTARTIVHYAITKLAARAEAA